MAVAGVCLLPGGSGAAAPAAARILLRPTAARGNEDDGAQSRPPAAPLEEKVPPGGGSGIASGADVAVASRKRPAGSEMECTGPRRRLQDAEEPAAAGGAAEATCADGKTAAAEGGLNSEGSSGGDRSKMRSNPADGESGHVLWRVRISHPDPSRSPPNQPQVFL